MPIFGLKKKIEKQIKNKAKWRVRGEIPMI